MLKGKNLSKLIIVLLVFLLSLPYGIFALASEADSSNQNNQTGSEQTTSEDINQEQILSTEQATPEVAVGEDTESSIPDGDDKQLSALTSSDDDSKFKNERETVTSQLHLQTDQVSGALIFSYPLNIPPGRNGLQPNLLLTYNNQNLEHDSVFGSGWSISIPYIQRLSKKGIDRMYESGNHYFYSSMSGELATTTASTTYMAKVDNGDFIKYEFIDGYWKAIDKKGTMYTFGSTSTAQMASSTKVYKWMIQEIRDTNDNFISFEYYKDYGQIYPSKIIYTGHDTTNGIFEIEFLRESRTDTDSMYYPGFSVQTRYRIYEIHAKINGTWVRKYELGYTIGDNNIKTLLNTITESGQDESSNTIILPDNNFDYQTNDSGWTLDSNFNISVDFIDGQNKDQGVRFADINGDGLVDMMRAVHDGYVGDIHEKSGSIYINNGDSTGWTQDNNYNIPVAFTVTPLGYDMGARFAEINGDGLIDIVSDWEGVWLNDGDGTGWTQTSTTIPFGFVSNWKDQGVRLADVNSDGLVDFLKASPFNNVNEVWINNGNNLGWTEDESYTIPVNFINTDYQDQGVRFADVNSDGLADIVAIAHDGAYADEHQKQGAIYLNKGDGTGWAQSTYNLPAAFSTVTGRDMGAHLVEVNGDGLPDFVSDLEGVWMNDGDGTGWTQTSTTKPYSFVDGNGKDQGVRVEDVDADGITDFIKSSAYGPVHTVYPANPYVADLLKHIDYDEGASVDVQYKTTPQYLDNNDEILNISLPLVLQTISTLVTNDGLGNYATSTYVYSGGDYYFTNSFDKKFAGFQIIETMDDAGNITKMYYHQGNESATSTGEYDDHISKVGKVYRVEKYDNSDNLYAKIINKWEHSNIEGDSNFVNNTRIVDFSYDGDGDHKEKAEEYSYDNGAGNIIQKIEYGQVNGSDDGTLTDTGNDKYITNYAYAASSTGYIIGLPSQASTTDQYGGKVKENKYYYDNLENGNVDKGNETKIEMWELGATYIDTEKTYSSYGLVTQEKDPRDKVTNYTYDQYNLYVVTSTNPLSQSINYLYDYSLGKVKKTVDPNDWTYEIIYDALDRPKEEKESEYSDPENMLTKNEYIYVDSPDTMRSIQKTSYLNAATSTVTYSYLDGFDRIYQKRKKAEDTNVFAVQDFIYDSIGLMDQESLPYFSTGSVTTTPTSTQELFSYYTYDALHRPLTVVNALATTTYAYDDWQTTITDGESNIKELYKDAYNNLIQVDENNSTSTYTTSYEYNYLNNLTKITDALNNVRNFTYDGLGRRLNAEDLHGIADSYYGIWLYEYDNSGNMTSSTNPNLQTVNYTYDDINRVLTENYTGNAGTEISYIYDSCYNGIGYLCYAATNNATTTYYYYSGSKGLVSTQISEIDSNEYITSYDYDRQGNYNFILYPDNSFVKYEYNNAGLLERVLQREEGENYSAVIEDIDYSPLEQISYIEYANGTYTTNTYDPEKLYRLVHKKTEYVGGMEMSALTSDDDIYSLVAALKDSNFEYHLAMPIPDNLIDSTYDISLANIINEYEKSSAVKNEYRLENATFVKEPIDKNSIGISVGDKNSAEFIPELTITKWDGEVAFSIAPNIQDVAKENQSLVLDGSTIKFKVPNKEYHFYSIKPSDKYPEGAYEFEVLFDKKPSTNVVEFNIATNDLVFYYQPPLDELFNDKTCTAFECQNMTADENIAGSYAAYHVNKKDHALGGHNYGTGKAFHIYRPKISDQVGNWVWGELNLDEELGILRVIIPQDFLDSAVYPIVVDPTFGNTSTGGYNYSGDNMVSAVKYSPSTSGKVTTIYTYAYRAGTDTGYLKSTLYDTSFNQLGTSTAETTNNLGYYTWKEVAYADGDEPYVIADTDYWITVWFNDITTTSNVIRADAGATGNARYETGVAYGGDWEDPWAGHIDSSILYSIYATYIEDSDPIVITKKATGINSSSATLNGDLDISGYDEVQTFFNYGIIPLYGATTSPITQTTSTSFSSLVSDLNTLDLYYYRAGASSSTNYWYGDEDRFYTGDISTSTWQAVQWQAGTNSTTTVEGNNLVLENSMNLVDEESFETGLGEWVNSVSDTCNWYRDSGGTPSSGTGPSTGKEGSYYAFVETSSGYCYTSGNTADLEYTLSESTAGKIEFYYHMYGSNIGTLYVDSYNGTSWSNRWSLTGNQGDNWSSMQTATFPVGTTKVRFHYVAAGGYLGDAAIDVINVYEGSGYSNGYWVSLPLDASSISNVDSSKIEWSAITPTSTFVTVYTAITNSSTTQPTIWDTATSSSSIVGASGDLSGKYLWVKVNLSTTSGQNTPVVEWLAYGITDVYTSGGLQNLTYTYDKVGNIIQIVDNSDTDTAKTVDYVYDDLYRLISASSTGATTDFIRTYAYNALGNITNKSDQGGYSYDGNTGTRYENPHAVTGINSNDLYYDNNGNLTSYDNWVYDWDYDNHLMQATNGAATSTYGYDHEGNRIFLNNGSNIAYYPNKYYNVTSSTSTKYIYVGNILVATIEGNSSSTNIYYTHTDHLTGSNVITDGSGNTVQVLDYYPFGDLRINEQYGSYDVKKKFSGYEYDTDTDLNYLGSRYYPAIYARFLSQDLAYLALGNNNQLKQVTGQKLEKYLSDPQALNSPRTTARNGLNSMSGFGWRRNTVAGGNSMSEWAEYLADPQMQNSYSYARNNPITMSDPDGNWAVHFDFTTNAGLGGEVGNAWTVGFASDGTFGVSTSLHGGGLAGADASIGVAAGYSNAKTWSDTLGTGQYVSVGGKVIGGGNVTTNFSNGEYSGIDVGVGIGARLSPVGIPVTFSGGVNKSVPVFQASISGIVNGVKNVASSVANSVSNGSKKIINKLTK